MLREVAAYFDNKPNPGTPEGDRFILLTTLVGAYKAKHYSKEPPDPLEAIKFCKEQSGLYG